MLDWLYPQTVEIVHSKFNSDIKVVRSRGRYSVWVGGFEQSGVMVEALWRKGLKEAEKYFPAPPKNVLILGFGCGSAAKLISQEWPQAKIVGVEIDQVMIVIAKKYFKINELPNTKIDCEDGIRYINALKQKQDKFDLILVDIYQGKKHLVLLKEKALFRNCRGILTRNGLFICNILSFRKPNSILQRTKNSISNNFQIRRELRFEYNLMEIATNKNRICN